MRSERKYPCSESESLTKITNGQHHKFIINGYSLLKASGKQHIKSGTFRMGGYKWEMRFYPSNTNFVSVELEMKSKLMKSGVTTLLQWKLLDQSGKGKHYLAASYIDKAVVWSRQEQRGSGFSYIQTDLENSDYLMDDRLEILCTMEVIKTRSLSGCTCLGFGQ